MITLVEDLQLRKNSLNEFRDLTTRVLNHLPNVLSNPVEKDNFSIFSSTIAGTTKYIRPINNALFISSADKFQEEFDGFIQVLTKLRLGNQNWNQEQKHMINSVLYTIQQAIGAGLDLLVNPNSARKHVGNRFEELIRTVFNEMGISNKKTILQIPYQSEAGTKTYKCENDLILSRFEKVRSSEKNLDRDEIVVSIKTTSKDRMGKIFIDKMLLERFVGHPQKVIGIFLNDVQRKEHKSISYTLVSGLFMVYTNFLTELEGVYYLDPPPSALRSPINQKIKTFAELVTTDIWELLAP